jgi:hypothetical protein
MAIRSATVCCAADTSCGTGPRVGPPCGHPQPTSVQRDALAGASRPLLWARTCRHCRADRAGPASAIGGGPRSRAGRHRRPPAACRRSGTIRRDARVPRPARRHTGGTGPLHRARPGMTAAPWRRQAMAAHGGRGHWGRRQHCHRHEEHDSAWAPPTGGPTGPRPTPICARPSRCTTPWACVGSKRRGRQRPGRWSPVGMEAL